MQLAAMAGTAMANAGASTAFASALAGTGTFAAANAAAGMAGTIGSLAAGMGTVGNILSGLGAVTSLVGGSREAGAATASAKVAADQERASGIKAQQEELRRGRLVASRAQAVAAAGGGSLTDPTVAENLGDIAAEAKYRSLVELHEGNQRAKNTMYQGGMNAYSARKEGAAGFMKGATNIFSDTDFSGLSEKYRTKKSGTTYQTPFGNREFFG